MRAIVRTEYGPPDGIRMVEAELPQPGAREVRVRVEPAGVDIGVWHMMSGAPTMMRLPLGPRTPRQAGLGSELAGVWMPWAPR